MPELPEVERIRRQLQAALRGVRIAGVEVLLPRMVERPSPREYERGLRGKTIRKVDRRGKYLLLRLDDGGSLLFHLGMTGRLLVVPEGGDNPVHTRVVLRLEGHRKFLFVDTRTFGRTALLPPGGEHSYPPLLRLGPEPLDPLFGPGDLARVLSGRGPVKAQLLDQARIAGIGNIYADEALFRAGIHPRRPGSTLTRREVESLHRALVEVLTQAVEKGGSTIRDYADLRGEAGTFQDHHAVYGRAGKPCPRCGRPVERTRISGRSAHFCPRCQR